MAEKKRRIPLGITLVEQNLITEEQLKEALAESEKSGEPLRKVLIRLGMVTEEDIISFYVEQMGIPRVDLSSYLIDPKIVGLIPEALSKKYQVIPLFKTKESLTVAMTDPLNVVAIDELKLKTGLNIEATIAGEVDIRQAINQYYGVGGSIEEVLKSIDIEALSVEEEDAAIEKLHEVAEEAPIIKLVNLIMMQAIRDRASDIHVEPEESSVKIRFRIDGILHDTSEIPKHLQAAIISRIKIMSDMNIALKRAPQDGRFGINLEGSKIDLRVSTFPTIHGENVVMRLLDATSILLGLGELGFSEENFNHFNKLIKQPNGIILVTGPTGSGKTTTLYSALNTINTPDKNIITIEDPVEYQLKGIRQSQINPKAGLTFANGLRSILRQDPDIVMVGEIRDKETAEIAIQAALTGHLVFSTLHTNDAPGALTRLIDMGIEPFLISSSVIGILAQRLVRKLCESCKKTFKPSEKLLEDLGIPLPKVDLTFYKSEGCKVCKNTGYKGRIGIFELITVDDKIRDLVLTKTSSTVIKRAAEEAGMKTLREDGLIKILAGQTSIDEVIRVTQVE